VQRTRPCKLEPVTEAAEEKLKGPCTRYVRMRPEIGIRKCFKKMEQLLHGKLLRRVPRRSNAVSDYYHKRVIGSVGDRK
jgi:hypothetical protein